MLVTMMGDKTFSENACALITVAKCCLFQNKIAMPLTLSLSLIFLSNSAEMCTSSKIGKGKHASVFEQQRDDTAVSEHAPEWFKMKNLVAFQKKLDAGEVKRRHLTFLTF